MATNREKVPTTTRSGRHPRAWLRAVSALAAINVIVAPSSASAQPDGALAVEVVKFPTPVFGVRLAELDKGAPPNDMDITGPPENQTDMDGGQASQTFAIRPSNQPTAASAIYDVEQNGQHVGTFRVGFRLGSGGSPNNLEVTCDEQDSPVHCWAWQDPFIVRICPKEPGLNN